MSASRRPDGATVPGAFRLEQPHRVVQLSVASGRVRVQRLQLLLPEPKPRLSQFGLALVFFRLRVGQVHGLHSLLVCLLRLHTHGAEGLDRVCH